MADRLRALEDAGLIASYAAAWLLGGGDFINARLRFMAGTASLLVASGCGLAYGRLAWARRWGPAIDYYGVDGAADVDLEAGGAFFVVRVDETGGGERNEHSAKDGRWSMMALVRSRRYLDGHWFCTMAVAAGLFVRQAIIGYWRR